MDVWFDSGSTHAGVLDQRPYLKFPADVYLEGGDQYRGWFQSSMLTSIAAKGVAPYKQIITHGWTVDGEGKVMHKSLGNAIGPEEVIKDYGADLLRLWVASAEYTQDMRISKDIMKQLSQAYLKIRNTARYMLGNLDGFNPDALTPVKEMAGLDRWALARFNTLVQTCRDAYERYEFHGVYRAIYNFCVIDLSNFYLDIIKDRLYCEEKDGALRRSAQSAMYRILDGMTRLLGPILAFTSEEIWAAMPHHKEARTGSVLFNDIPAYDPALALDEAESKRWSEVITVRGEVNKALELARNEQGIKKNQDAGLVLGLNDTLWEGWNKGTFLTGFDEADLAALCIVSQVKVAQGAAGFQSEAVPGLAVQVAQAAGAKCPRCWNHNEHVNADGLCPRCAAVVSKLS